MTADRIAIFVHPTRDVSGAMEALREWAAARDVEIVELGGDRLAPQGSLDDAWMVVALGGDGTVLAALRAAAETTVPVLGVAGGSLGALTTVAASDLTAALDRFEAGDWTPHRIPALAIVAGDGEQAEAINDIVVVRGGGSQVMIGVEIDGALYGRFAGDGVIVATQLGSSAYSMAAGGPVIVPDSRAWVVTPLAPHGGSVPPVVVGAGSRVRLDVHPGYMGARVEIDGHETALAPRTFDIALRADYATLVRIGGEEEYLAGLRRRRIIMDSPRVLARDDRAAASAAAPPGPAPGSGSPRRPG